MVRYIDADKLLERLKSQYGEDLGWQCTINMSDVGMMIEDAPTADVEEVVRCEKCKYSKTHTCAITGIKSFFCDYGEKPVVVQPTHFCSYGERAVNYESSKYERK